MNSANKFWTKGQKPSYQDRVNMIAKAISVLGQELVKNAFKLSGLLMDTLINHHGKELIDQLHPRLQEFLHSIPQQITPNQAVLLDLVWTSSGKTEIKLS